MHSFYEGNYPLSLKQYWTEIFERIIVNEKFNGVGGEGQLLIYF